MILHKDFRLVGVVRGVTVKVQSSIVGIISDFIFIWTVFCNPILGLNPGLSGGTKIC